MGRGLSKPNDWTPEEYAEYKRTAEGNAELTEPEVEDVPEYSEGDLSRDAAEEEFRKDEDEEARAQMSPEERRQLAEMGNYTRLEFRGEKLDDLITLNVFVKDLGAERERLLMTLERPGYNFGTLRSLRIRYGGVYNHSQETARQIQRLEREEGFFIEEIRFFLP